MRSLGSLHERAVHQRRIERLAEHLASLVPVRARVLDVGCGDGRLAARLGELRPDLVVHGIDVLARPRSPIPIEIFDGRRIPAGDDAWDVVTCVDVLHHADEPTALLEECARVSRQAVVLKDHLRDGIAAGATLRLMDWVGNAPHGVRLPYNYLSRREWEGAWRRLGLQVEEWRERLGLYPVPADWIFGRGLHFVARLSKRGSR